MNCKILINGNEQYKNSVWQLDLNKSKITKIPKCVSELVYLSKLNISKNQLTKLPKFLSRLVNLQILNCSYNKIKKIPYEFVHSPIYDIDISFNPFVKLDKKIQPKSMHSIRTYLKFTRKKYLLCYFMIDLTCNACVLDSLIKYF
jgi:Leucine-rich repeat (LRR) protein